MSERIERTTAERLELARVLGRSMKGGVRFDDGARALYASDASNYRQVPIGVVTPRDAGDVSTALAACREVGAPVLSRGGGTSLAGQCCNTALILDFSRHMNAVVSVDPNARRAVVEPGTVLDVLRDRAEQHGLTFGPDPSTHNRCTLGGMIGNNSCGVHSVMAGRTVDNVEEMEVVTYDGLRLRVGPTSDDELAAMAAAGGRRGEIYAGLRSIRDRYGDLIRERYPRIPRRVSGYNLDELLPENGCNVARALVGTEGTCVVVLEATTRLVPSPPVRNLLVVGFPDVFDAADAVPMVLEHGVIGLEGLDEQLVNDIRAKGGNTQQLHVLPKGGGWLLAEFGAATIDEADEQARALMKALDDTGSTLGMRLLDDPDEEERLWLMRESGLGATASVQGRADTCGRGGRTRPCRRSGWATTCESSRRCSNDTATTPPPCTATSVTGASTPGSTSISAPATASPTTALLPRRPPTSCCLMAARSQGSTVTGSHGPSCCPGCSEKSWSRPSACSRVSGILTGR